MQTYFTHNNGGRPFKVVVSPTNTVKVFREVDALRAAGEYEKVPVFEARAKRVFVGHSPLNRMTKFSKGYGKLFDGNSILIETGDNQYVFIGHVVLSFKSEASIEAFVSPVGNNDVPYPYAVDANGAYYLLIEDVVVENVPRKGQSDPYDFYYTHGLMTTDMGIVPQVKPVRGFEDIEEFWIGDERYTMRYVPRPAKDYNRIVRFEEGPVARLYLKKTGARNRQELSKEEYVKLMKRFGREKGFRPISRAKVLFKERF